MFENLPLILKAYRYLEQNAKKKKQQKTIKIGASYKTLKVTIFTCTENPIKQKRYINGRERGKSPYDVKASFKMAACLDFEDNCSVSGSDFRETLSNKE